MSETIREEKRKPIITPIAAPVDAATLILVDRAAITPKVLVGKRHDKGGVHARQIRLSRRVASTRQTIAFRWPQSISEGA